MNQNKNKCIHMDGRLVYLFKRVQDKLNIKKYC